MKRHKAFLKIAIDASRSKSGGAIEHIKCFLSAAKPLKHEIKEIHIWSTKDLLESIPNYYWLQKHNVPFQKSSIILNLFWQFFIFPKKLKKNKIDILFKSDAGSVCFFQPNVTLSQDMLSFEKSEIKRYHIFSRERLRLEILKLIQLRSLKKSTAAIFLTEYAQDQINKFCKIKNSFIIPHGIREEFHDIQIIEKQLEKKKTLNCLYVSNAAPYKHQWNVIEAIRKVRDLEKREIKIKLIGGGKGESLKRTLRSKERNDPEGSFVSFEKFLPHKEIIKELEKADIFIFASTCENLPITLLEAMSTGIPIVSSNRRPMIDILNKEFIFFDPLNINSLVEALIKLIRNQAKVKHLQFSSKNLSKNYSWEITAKETLALIVNTYKSQIN